MNFNHVVCVAAGILIGLLAGVEFERWATNETFEVSRFEINKQISECQARLPRDENCVVATSVIPGQIAEELKRELRRLETYRAERTSDAAI